MGGKLPQEQSCQERTASPPRGAGKEGAAENVLQPRSPSAGAESPHPVYHLLSQWVELCVGVRGNTLLPPTSIWSK